MDSRELLYSELKKANARLVRKKKHEVWELPNGKVIVIGRTPSDQKSALNTLSDLRKALGAQRKQKTQADFDHKKKQRRPRRRRRAPVSEALSTGRASEGKAFAQKLKEALEGAVNA